MDGTIITANENFLKALGYSLAEIKGKHHSLFVEASERDSVAHREFWAKLNRGEYQRRSTSASARAARKSGSWPATIRSSMTRKKPFKVVKFATDVTDQKLNSADLAGQIDAIGKSQAVIEFNMDGTIITANANFLDALGYSLDEIPGQHHSLFVETSERERRISRVLGRPQSRQVSGRRIQADRQGRQGDLDSGLLQPDPRSERQAIQGREIPNRHHRSGRCAHEE